MKLSISARLGLGFGLVLAAMLTGALVMTVSLDAVKDRALTIRSQSLPLATGVEKRVTVIAAGFPGHLIKSDPAVQALAKGDPTAAPELVMSEGKVEVIHTHQNGIPIVVHSADISQGNSGGPLVDRCGRVVGINTFIDTDPQSGRRGLYSLGSADLIAFLTAQNAPVRIDTATCPPSGS